MITGLGIKSRIKATIDLIMYKSAVKKCDVVLLDTPVYNNLGDHAIVIAQKQLALKNNLKACEATAIQIDNQEIKYASVTPSDKVILIPGGGFIGSLWPLEEERLRRIIKAFSRHKIIIFPQTVFFDVTNSNECDYLRESVEVYSSHSDLTVFVRDKNSFEFMKSYFPRVKVALTPDIVLSLDSKVEENREGILFCLRKDLEKKVESRAWDSIKNTVLKMYPEETITYTDTALDFNVRPAKREYLVKNKLNQFASSKLVVTDRLHGMIFSAITGTPCIAFDNVSNKVSGTYEWIRDLDYIKFVNNSDEFDKLLNQLDISKGYEYPSDLLNTSYKALYEVMRTL